MTAVSKGAEFGFTSQLTYSFQHGYDKMAVTDWDISMMGMKLIDIKGNAMNLSEITLGGTITLGCIIGFLLGGWVSQYSGKRIMLVASNFGSFIIWIMLALTTARVEFVIFARFSMGVFSAAASGCVGTSLLV